MGKKTILFDDIDGTQDDVQGVTLTFNGQTKVLDLSVHNREKLEQLLAPYLAVGTNYTARPRRRQHPKSEEIRAWAQEQGLEVGARGLLADSVVSAWEARNQEQAQDAA